MSSDANKFGAFKGVFVPSILTILGVILFLRLGWVIGQAGLSTTFLIITLSSVITFITALSISSTATNTELGAGGSYYLISRCFGVEPGAAVGLPLYLAQALGISFYVVGFAESLQLFFPSLPITTVAFGTLVFLTAVTFFSSDLALKMQIFILALIVLSLLSFWFGTPLPEVGNAPESIVRSFGFWEIFAVFFPAVTGIEAGISMSGDLKNPRKALPVATIAAVVVGYVVYMFSAYMLSTLAPTDVLITNSLVMTSVAAVSIIIFIGLWGATLSSAMGALLGAPRTMQALAKDKVLPAFLAKGSKESNDPRAATVVSFVIAGLGVLLGDLNSIATILSMFFLTSYGALNLVSGLEGLLDNPSWRPTFRISWFVSLLGAFLCFGAMFMIDSGATFVALAAIVGVYYFIKRRNVQSKHSDIRTGLTMRVARESIYTLNELSKDARNWRPNFLILSGAPKSRFHLIDLAYQISHQKGFMTVASIITEKDINPEKLFSFEDSTRAFLKKQGVLSLTKVIEAHSIYEGAKELINTYGLGEIKPNTVLLGDTSDISKLDEYIKIIDTTYKRKKNIVIAKDSSTTEQVMQRGGSSIDIWWRGSGENVNLMLTLAYMLKTSKKWKKANLVLRSIAKNEKDKAGIEKSLENFISSSRIPAHQEIYIDSHLDPFSIIQEKSRNSEIVFLGLKTPEDSKEYQDYYINLLKSTSNLKTVLYVLEGEDLSFSEIFK